MPVSISLSAFLLPKYPAPFSAYPAPLSSPGGGGGTRINPPNDISFPVHVTFTCEIVDVNVNT